MNTSTSTNQKGFTIIEVVLVLAIAGLIFLLVFLAVPALQRSQRDTQRRDDLSRFAAQVSNYQANNKGAIPTTANAGAFVTSYLRVGGDQFADPSGTDYSITAGTTSNMSSNVAANEIIYYTNATCSGENAVAGGGARKFAARVDLEGGGSFCVNN